MDKYRIGVGIYKYDGNTGEATFLIGDSRESHSIEVGDLIVESAEYDETEDGLSKEELIKIRVDEIKKLGFTRISRPKVVASGVTRFDIAVCTEDYLEKQLAEHKNRLDETRKTEDEQKRRMQKLDDEADDALSTL